MKSRARGTTSSVRALVLLAAALLGCSEKREPARAPRREALHLSVATFNLYFPGADDAQTLEAVGATAADVVFLQEVSPAWETRLRQRFAQGYPHQLFAATAGAGGLGALSRFPLGSERAIPALFRHPAWLIRVEAPGTDLLVLNVHLRSSTRRGQSLLPGLFSMAADHEAEIRSFLAAYPELPDLVVGDFNEDMQGKAVTWLLRHGFVDALSRYRPEEPTWRTLGGLYRRSLDHILFRGCVQALDAWVLRAGNSDHWPLVARLEVDPGQHRPRPRP
jgi:endonuclease/exonuclease/phosphatase (EEP) superfamily protein YafD